MTVLPFTVTAKLKHMVLQLANLEKPSAMSFQVIRGFAKQKI